MQTAVPDSIVQALQCADFLLFDTDGHSLGIERKTASDLLASLGAKMANGNHRLDDQLDRMTEAYTHRMLIVEGWPEFDRNTRKLITGSRESGWFHTAVQSRLWSLLTTTDTSLIHTSDRWATADWIRHLHKRSEGGCVLPHSLRIEMEQAA